MRYGLVLLGYIAAGAACIALAVPTGNNSPVWVPTGVALAAVLRWGARMLWPTALGSLAVNTFLFVHHDRFDAMALAGATGVTAGNVLTVACAHWLLTTGFRSLTGRARIGVHGYIAVTAACAWLGAGVGTLVLTLGAIVPVKQAAEVATLWWLADALGMLLIAPLIGTWAHRDAVQAVRARLASFALGMLLAAGGSWLVFQWSGNGATFWMPFTMLGVVMWYAMRLGPLGSTLAGFLIAVNAAWATLLGQGPFAARDQYYSLLTLGMYVALVAITGLIVTNSTGSRGRNVPSQAPGQWPLVTLALCLGITVAVSQLVTLYADRRVQEQFRSAVDTSWKQMDYRLSNYRRMLLAGKAYVDASGNVGVAAWRKYVGDFDLPANHPGTLGLGYAHWITDDAAYRRFAARQAGDRPGWRTHPEPIAVPAAVVSLIEPDNARNARALGYNLMSDPVRRAALVNAARTGKITSTGTVTLVQETDRTKQLGFLMFAPLYGVDEAALKTEAERMAALTGFVFSPFRIRDMVHTMLEQTASLSVRIYDLHAAGRGQELFSDSAKERAKPSRNVRPLLLERNLVIDAAGHRWRVVFSATPAFEAGVDKGSPLLALGLGATISFLLFEIVRGMAVTRGRALEIAQGITRELQSQQAAVRETEERFRLFTSSVHSHAIIYLDAEGLVEAWNEGATNLFGYDSAETVGRPLALWADPGKGADLLRQARAAGTATDVTPFVCKEGACFVGELQMSVVRRDGELAGFSFLVRDVTATQEAEAQLRRAVALAEEASRAKGAFVANMSHELRTPMNGVLGLAAVLERGPLSQEQRDIVKMIRSSGETLLAVLNDILDFSKIEAGKVELDLGPAFIDDLALACARQMAIAGGEAIRMLVDVAPALPPAITTDALRLEQVLTNLVGNALKFTERGVVECRFLPGPPIEGKPTLRVDVKDTGIGMSAEQQKRLFSPFTQADVSTTRRFGGTGLGLTIARGFADLLGGTLTVASQEGQGSTFTLVVPMTPAQVGDRYMLPPGHRDLSVLVCEPDADVAAAIANATARWSWHLHCVRSVDEFRMALQAPGELSYALAITGTSIRAAEVAGIISAAAVRLPRDFALIRAVAGFDAPDLAAIPSIETATLHAPATRAALHDAVLQVRAHSPVAAVAPAAMEPASADAPLQGLRILLAEDNAINQVVAMAMLEYAGAVVDVANDGSEAVELLRRAPHGYGVVLMDVQMPVMDGLAASRAIRRELRLGVPIVAMTAGVTEEERRACVEAGMEEFVSKPVEEEILVDLLRKYRPA